MPVEHNLTSVLLGLIKGKNARIYVDNAIKCLNKSVVCVTVDMGTFLTMMQHQRSIHKMAYSSPLMLIYVITYKLIKLELCKFSDGCSLLGSL